MKHHAKVSWEKHPQELFTDNCYHRTHDWFFDGGASIIASSSPSIVPVPFSDPAAVDPEEAFVASVASCHMLFFLHIAANQGYSIASYKDNAEGFMQANDQKQMAFKVVKLHPHVIFDESNVPSDKQVNEMHGKAHSQCFIANSIKATIEIIPVSSSIN